LGVAVAVAVAVAVRVGVLVAGAGVRVGVLLGDTLVAVAVAPFKVLALPLVGELLVVVCHAPPSG
jgi:hypothetical protein